MENLYWYQYVLDGINELTLCVHGDNDGENIWEQTYPSWTEDPMTGDMIQDLTPVEMGVIKSLDDLAGIETMLKAQNIIPADAILKRSEVFNLQVFDEHGGNLFSLNTIVHGDLDKAAKVAEQIIEMSKADHHTYAVRILKNSSNGAILNTVVDKNGTSKFELGAVVPENNAFVDEHNYLALGFTYKVDPSWTIFGDKALKIFVGDRSGMFDSMAYRLEDSGAKKTYDRKEVENSLKQWAFKRMNEVYSQNKGKYATGGVIDADLDIIVDRIADEVATNAVMKHPVTARLSVAAQSRVAIALTDFLVKHAVNMYHNDSNFRDVVRKGNRRNNMQSYMELWAKNYLSRQRFEDIERMDKEIEGLREKAKKSYFNKNFTEQDKYLGEISRIQADSIKADKDLFNELYNNPDVTVLTISSGNPLDKQLRALTGDGYTSVHFDGNPGMGNLLVHKKTGRKFTSLNAIEHELLFGESFAKGGTVRNDSAELVQTVFLQQQENIANVRTALQYYKPSEAVRNLIGEPKLETSNRSTRVKWEFEVDGTKYSMEISQASHFFDVSSEYYGRVNNIDDWHQFDSRTADNASEIDYRIIEIYESIAGMNERVQNIFGDLRAGKQVSFAAGGQTSSIIGKKKDLKGNEKEYWMYTLDELKDSVSEEQARSIIKNAAENQQFYLAILYGKINAADAVAMIESAGLDVPDNILWLLQAEASGHRYYHYSWDELKLMPSSDRGKYHDYNRMVGYLIDLKKFSYTPASFETWWNNTSIRDDHKDEVRLLLRENGLLKDGDDKFEDGGVVAFENRSVHSVLNQSFDLRDKEKASWMYTVERMIARGYSEKTAINTIRKAIEDNSYLFAITHGRLSAGDVIEIIRSAGLSVPEEILFLDWATRVGHPYIMYDSEDMLGREPERTAYDIYNRMVMYLLKNHLTHFNGEGFDFEFDIAAEGHDIDLPVDVKNKVRRLLAERGMYFDFPAEKKAAGGPVSYENQVAELTEAARNSYHTRDYAKQDQYLRERSKLIIDNLKANKPVFDNLYNNDDVMVLLVSASKPLSNQLQEITGDSYNAIDFTGSAALGNILIHKDSGQKFTVLNEIEYQQVYSESFAGGGSISEKVEEHLNERQKKKEFKDVGKRVGGSKKEKRAYTLITSSDLGSIEDDDVLAARLVVKDKVYPEVNVAEEKAKGVNSGAAFLKVKLREACGTKPPNDKNKRASFVRFIEEVTKNTALVKTVDEFVSYLTSIRSLTNEQIIGYLWDPSFFDASDEIKAKLEVAMNTIFKWSFSQSHKIEQLLIEVFGKRFANFIMMRGDTFHKILQEAEGYEGISAEEAKVKIENYLELNENGIKHNQAKIDEYKGMNDEMLIKAMQASSSEMHKLFKNNPEGFRKMVIEVYEGNINKHKERLVAIPEKIKERPDDWSWFEQPKERATGTKSNEIVINSGTPLAYIKRTGGLFIDEKYVDQAKSTDPESNPITDTFGFKSVQFGIAIKNDESRQHVKHFLGAMSDMAEILNADLPGINGIGGLSIAFAARGSRGAMAHYERDYRIINITNNRGDGTVAHEYSHYVDNVIAILLSGNDKPELLATEMIVKGKYGSNKYPELTAALKNLMKFIYQGGGIADIPFIAVKSEKPVRYYDNQSKEFTEIKLFDTLEETLKYFKDHSLFGVEYYTDTKGRDTQVRMLGYIINHFGKEMHYVPLKVETSLFLHYSSRMSSKYWVRPQELFARAWETFIFDKLDAKGRMNNYLVSGEYFDAEVMTKDGYLTYVYPFGEERKHLDVLYDRLVTELIKAAGIKPFEAFTSKRQDEYISYDNKDEEVASVEVVKDNKKKKLVEGGELDDDFDGIEIINETYEMADGGEAVSGDQRVILKVLMPSETVFKEPLPERYFTFYTNEQGDKMYLKEYTKLKGENAAPVGNVVANAKIYLPGDNKSQLNAINVLGSKMIKGWWDRLEEPFPSEIKMYYADGGVTGPFTIGHSFFIRDILVDKELFNSLPEENRKAILELKLRFDNLGYIDVRTEVGPSQWHRTSVRQRETLMAKASEAFRIERQLKELLKTPEQVGWDKLEQDIKFCQSKITAKRNYIDTLKRVYAVSLASSRDNKHKKSIAREEAMLASLEEELKTLKSELDHSKIKNVYIPFMIAEEFPVTNLISVKEGDSIEYKGYVDKGEGEYAHGMTWTGRVKKVFADGSFTAAMHDDTESKTYFDHFFDKKELETPIMPDGWAYILRVNPAYKKGGRITRKEFDKVVKSVADQYKGKSVPAKYQDKYGKRYSGDEAESVGYAVANTVFRGRKKVNN